MFQKHRSSLRFLLHIGDASHMYSCHCFFQRGETSYRGHGSTSTWEHSSLIDTLLLGGGLPRLLLLLFGGGLFPHRRFFPSPSFLYMDVCRNGGVLITPSIHASFLISLFGGGFFPCGFPSFPTLWEIFICISFFTWVPKMA